tara:strand:- start:619 stop:1200 length:582 start_codon:yes stop_codon:yes gene_type:complete
MNKQQELKMRLDVLIPMKWMLDFSSNVEREAKDILSNIIELNQEWVAEVVNNGELRLTDVLHDFRGIYSEDEHFLPRIQPATPVQELNDVSNYRQIKVKYLGATDMRGSRVCIYEPKRYNDDTTKRVYLSYDYSVGCTQQQAYNYLISKGFNIVAKASELENYIFLADNWADEFRELKTGLIRKIEKEFPILI